MFIRIKDARYGDSILINIDKIATIEVDARVVTMCGNHGEGNGLIHTTAEDMEKILKHIEVE